MIDLHLHLDGSLSEELIRRLAECQHIALPEGVAQSLSVSSGCRDLNEYLRCFELPLSLLQTEDALRLAVRDLTGRLYAQRLIYAEIRFAPQLHTRLGLSQAEVTEAAVQGLQGAAIPARLILCCMRGRDNSAANRQTVRTAAEYLGKGVCGLDLAGAEGLYPTREYRALFAMAREAGIPCTIHAGEAAGPDSIREALACGASRIGHGVRLREDPKLLEEIRERQIPLEMCPTSNLQTKAASSLREYPLLDYLARGIAVTVNTDNMTVSSTTLAREYALLGLSPAQICQVQQNAADAAFLSSEGKTRLRELLSAGKASDGPFQTAKNMLYYSLD